MVLLHVENAKSPYRGRGDTPLPPLGRFAPSYFRYWFFILKSWQVWKSILEFKNSKFGEMDVRKLWCSLSTVTKGTAMKVPLSTCFLCRILSFLLLFLYFIFLFWLLSFFFLFFLSGFLCFFLFYIPFSDI